MGQDYGVRWVASSSEKVDLQREIISSLIDYRFNVKVLSDEHRHRRASSLLHQPLIRPSLKKERRDKDG
jgi:hypothetical protein